MTVASQVKQTLASLKGVRGNLRVYSIQAQYEQTRSVFNNALKETDSIIESLEHRIQTIEFEEPQFKGN